MSRYFRIYVILSALLLSLNGCGQPEISQSPPQESSNTAIIPQAGQEEVLQPLATREDTVQAISTAVTAEMTVQVATGVPTPRVASATRVPGRSTASSLLLGIESIVVNGRQATLKIWLEAPEDFKDVELVFGYESGIHVLTGSIPRKVDVIANERQEYEVGIILEGDKAQDIALMATGPRTYTGPFNEVVTATVMYRDNNLEVKERENSTKDT